MYKSLMVLALVLVITLPMIPVSANQEPTWIHFSITPTSAVYYDYDNDGVTEIVLPGAIIEGYSLIASPYPPLPFVYKADLDGDGINELIVYGNGELYIYDGMKEVKHFTVPDVEPIKTRYAFAFDNLIIWDNKTYTIEGNIVSVVPVADRNHLYALYYRDGYLRLLNVITGNEVSIYEGFIPIYGVLDGNYIYIVATTQDGNLAVIKYEMGGSPQIGVYTVSPQAVMGFNPITKVFYIKANNKLYSASVTSLLLVSEWEPVSADEEYIYLYNTGTIAVFNTETGNTEATIQLPLAKKPSLVVGYPKPIAVFPDDGTYVLYTGTPIYITFYGSSGVRAGVPYHFTVSVRPESANYTIMVDGVPISPDNTTVVFTKLGYHNITVHATNGIITIKKTYHVYVYPRPLRVSLEVVKPPMAYSLMEIIVHTLDGDTPVNLSCTIKLPNGEIINGTTNHPITIPVGVPRYSHYTIYVNITGDMYGKIRKIYNIPVVPEPVKPVVSFLGNGTFQIDIVSAVGEKPVNGTLKIYYGTKLLYSGNVPGVIHLDEAGNYTLKLTFYPYYHYAFKQGQMMINITYLGEQETIPEINGTQIVAVDHIINQTKVVVKNQTVTVTERIPQPVPKPTLDTPMAMFFLVVGLGAGIPVGMVVGVEILRRRGILPPRRRKEEETKSDKEEGEEMEVSEKDLFTED